MKKILFLLLFITPLLGFSQTDTARVFDGKEPFTSTPNEPTPKILAEVFEAVEHMPVYPGGDEARKKFILKNIVYPDSSLKHNRQGKVYVRFVVEIDSSISNVRAVKAFDDESAAEAIRVTKMMRWIPGTQRGKAVRVYVVMPIVFKIY